MEIIRKAELARRLKVSKSRVTQLLRTGLPQLSDGMIDFVAAQKWLANNSRTKKSQTKISETKALIGSVPLNTLERPLNKSSFTLDTPGDQASAPMIDPANDDAVSEFIARLLRGDLLTTLEADRVKANGLALKHTVAARRAARAVIDIEVARDILFETSRSARDSWLNWPTRIAPHMAAEVGIEIDQLVEILTRYVHEHISELGDPDGGALERAATE